MRRTEAVGNDGNLYTEGNPALGVPATVVGAIEMNLIQEEICNAIEDAGLTVDQTAADDTQLLQAIKILIENGGTIESSMTIPNNQSVEADVSAIPAFDKTKFKSAKMMVDVYRRDDSQDANELYELSAIYNPNGDAWSLHFVSTGDDSGMTFSINSAGQIRFISSNFSGANYSGKLRVSHVKKIAITL